ncbi:MAG: Na+ dependent nucleoside transporter N-terminal domain-containing protein, partial [Pseudomonadota bacterium]
MSRTLLTVVAMLVFLCLAYAFSTNRRAISLRTVGAALGLQVLLGALALYVPAGRAVLEA